MHHDSEEHTLALWLVSETEKAYLVCNDPFGVGDDLQKWWLPKSQMRRVNKEHRNGELTSITFTLPEWLVKKNNLWDYAT